MTILFMGGEMGAFTPSGSGVTESTEADMFDSDFARCAMSLDGTISTPNAYYADGMEWAEETGDFYLHFDEAMSGNSAVSNIVLALLNGAGAEVFRIQQAFVSTDVYTWQMQYLNVSAVWTNAGATITKTSTLGTYELFVDTTNGDMSLFASGTELVTVTGLALSHNSGVANVRLYSADQARHVSQVVAADVPTIGFRLMTRHATGTGAHTAWTGDYTDIDETIYDDVDFAAAGSAGLKESYTHSGPTISASYVVLAAGVAIRGKTSGGVTGVKALFRIGSTDYASSAFTLTAGYTANVAIWEDDPSTGVDWANAQIANVQFGVESA